MELVVILGGVEEGDFFDVLDGGWKRFICFYILIEHLSIFILFIRHVESKNIAIDQPFFD